ncbi:MAG: alpha/beta hydrolase [Rhizobiales bacterium 65-9]|nr:alpha/beta fold hydrolase [Hyphomicrobiales bacterium]OJY33825.1 MAG: alpha/beta hydrolase [Rhizobiales bacterium 65-9]
MRHFSSDGVDIAFIDNAAHEPVAPGGGAPVMLVHGFASTHAVNWVNTLWTTTLGRAGFRVVALDHRGHGQSEKLYDPAQYGPAIMAEDVRRLMDHLAIERADVIGYSMGARITAQLAVAHGDRVRSAVLGGLGMRLVEGTLFSTGIAEAMEAPSIDDVTDPSLRTFRAFADQLKADRRALAACVRGSHQPMTREQCAGIVAPVLVAAGTKDPLANDPDKLAALFRDGRVLEIPGRDHNLAVGDRVHKQGVLDFLTARL